MSTKHFSVAIEPNEKYFLFSETSLNEMVNAVRAAEREACARVCEAHGSTLKSAVWVAEECAAAIRARNESGNVTTLGGNNV